MLNIKGFTFIELIIVMVIMAFLFAMVGPRVARDFGRLGLVSSAKQVAATMRYARSQAVNTSARHNVIFDTGNNRVIVVRSQEITPEKLMSLDLSGIGDVNGLPEGLKPPEPKIYSLPEGIGFYEIKIGEQKFFCVNETHILQMPFYPNGTSAGGTVVLIDSNESKMTVSVDYITGGISIVDDDEDR